MRCCLLVSLCLCPTLLTLAADPQPLFDSGVISAATPGHAKTMNLELKGAKELYLVVRDGGDGFGCDWADWAEPKLIGPNGETRLTDLKWKSATTGYGTIGIHRNIQGQPLRIAGKSVEFGIGTHANSVIAYDLPSGVTRFQATVGLDDGGVNQGCGSTVQFLVYAEKPSGSQLNAPAATADASSRKPEDAVANLDVHPELEATLFAAEPLLKNPSNIDVDHLGRVWVCEVVNYRRFANKDNPDRPEGDRILVLEDTNGDGVADKQTVFYQGKDVDSAHGICVLGDRVIISCGDSVFSLYDRDGDLKADPDSKEFLFTGISGTQHDHGIHAFVFGPDGKLYFNFGNSGGQLKDKHGKPIVDKAGNEINSSRKPYQEGMVFRCNLDGTDVETLGWNFRNNWEVAVDSFGTMWQSDNDDDGNRGVRINYVMEFGNYGYRDELTGAGWREPRTNMETEIPLQHWHLNDPGVIPNVLQTGAGSPTGICVYEGDLLPKIFHGQPIHCDAGPSVVRAYITKPDGAGYTAEIVNILQGARDNWFRPSDVCVAPDGSLIVADWYDPGVGGHRQGDVDRGRLFRVAPPGVKYTVPKVDVGTVAGAIEALLSPNQATRYLGWVAVRKLGDKALPALREVSQEATTPAWRARASWMLAKLPMGNALGNPQPITPEEQVAGIRLAQELYAPLPDAKGYAKSLTSDVMRGIIVKQLTNESPMVLRQCALALRPLPSDYKVAAWAELASKYDGKDRWMLEALGIGAGNDWDACLGMYLRRFPDTLQTKAGRDIIWRSRATQTPELIAKIVSDPQTPLEELPRFFRALDFLSGDAKNNAVTQLAFATTGSDERASLIIREALNRAPAFNASEHPERKAALEKALDQSRGTAQYLTLIQRFGVNERLPEVIAMVQDQPDSQFAVDAAKWLLGRQADLKKALQDEDPVRAGAIAKALGNSADGRIVGLLLPLATDAKQPLSVRQEAIKAVGKTKPGVQQLLERAKGDKLTDDLKPAVAFALQSSTFPEFRSDIAALFPLPPSRNDQPLPPLDQLYKRKGSIDQGKIVFNTVGKCNTCHIVHKEGKDVGPNLTEIGSKLSREAMFESILFPSAGISHNYESWTAVTNDGNAITGLLVSQTPQEIQLKGPDAIVRTIKRSDIDELVKQSISMMPADLQKTMTVEELVDVVEYMQTLKKQ